MKKLMIFPYTKKAEALAQFASSLQGFEIRSLVQLKGWGRLGEEHTCAGKEVCVTDDIASALREADVLCVVNTHIKVSVADSILPVVSQAIQLGKEVLVCRPLQLEEKRALQGLSGAEKIRFYGETPSHTTAKPMSLTTPVIGVAGVISSIGKWPGAPVIAHHLAPYTFDQAYMLENDVVSLLTLDDTYVNRKTEEWSLPNVRNYTEPEAAKQLCGSIIDQYGEYGALAMET